MVRKFKLSYEMKNSSFAVVGKKYESVACAPDEEAARGMLNPITCFNITCEEVDAATPHTLETWIMVTPKRAPKIEDRYTLMGDRYVSIEKLLSE